jgi:hypothetical protein
MPKSSSSPRDVEDVEPLRLETSTADSTSAAGSRRAEGVPVLAASDSGTLLSLCLALEREAQGKVQYLAREHLLAIHRSVATLKETIEEALVGGPVEGVH